jgi:hypothetical protein
MKTTCPIANVSPSKYTSPAVLNRRAEGYYSGSPSYVIPSEHSESRNLRL